MRPSNSSINWHVIPRARLQSYLLCCALRYNNNDVHQFRLERVRSSSNRVIAYQRPPTLCGRVYLSTAALYMSDVQ